jgi:hypothetical protein
LKAKKFEEIDFDKIVTEEAMREHLGYTIPENKTLLNKTGKAKKKDDATPGAPKKPVKKRSADP